MGSGCSSSMYPSVVGCVRWDCQGPSSVTGLRVVDAGRATRWCDDRRRFGSEVSRGRRVTPVAVVVRALVRPRRRGPSAELRLWLGTYFSCSRTRGGFLPKSGVLFSVLRPCTPFLPVTFSVQGCRSWAVSVHTITRGSQGHGTLRVDTVSGLRSLSFGVEMFFFNKFNQ